MWMLLKHSSDVLVGRKVDLKTTQDAYDLACVKFGAQGREQVCGVLGQLRNRIYEAKDSKDVREYALHVLRGLTGARN